jgi:putative addiction module killer protein
MHTLIQTDKYGKWFASLRDARAQARINIRLRRIELGVLGDCKPVGEGVSEMRIDYGPGYRVYFIQRGYELIILLASGDKGSQAKDIKSALKLARDLGDRHDRYQAEQMGRCRPFENPRGHGLLS